MLLSAAALAAGSISIDANSSPYSGYANINSVNYTSIDAVVTSGMTSAVAVYRTIHGPSSAPVNTTVTVTWKDRSKSKGKVVSTTSSVGVVPNGNPTPPPTGGGGGSGDPGDGAGSSGSGGSSSGSDPASGCYGHCKGTVIVGPIQT